MLAVSSAQRLAQYPDVPTFKESGYDIEGSAWYGLFAPAGTPQPIVDKLAAAAIEAVRQPDVRPEARAARPRGHRPRRRPRWREFPHATTTNGGR